jgi:hypothetical protein
LIPAQDFDVYSALASLPSLTTLLSVELMFGNKMPAENTATIRKLVSVCPKLRRLHWFMAPRVLSGSVVIIERNDKRVSWSLKLRVGDGESGPDNDWGEAGHGSFEIASDL